MKTVLLVCVLLAALVSVLVHERHRVLLSLWGSGSPPDLLAAADEGAGVRWHDDYFIVQAIDPRTYAIGEPRYHQQNFNYLIVCPEWRSYGD